MLNKEYAKLIKGDFKHTLAGAHGITKLSEATPDDIKNTIWQVLQMHVVWFAENEKEFKIFFRQTLSKEYKLSGLGHKLKKSNVI